MDYVEDMNHSRDFITAGLSIANNPHVSTIWKENRVICEQLIVCKCFAKYLVYVNGEVPISDTIMVDVFCPHCGRPASDFASISGHSAGCFNATVTRV